MFYRIMRYTLGPILRVFYRVRSEGANHVPRQGAVILASNHLAVVDSFFTPLVLPRNVHFLGKAEYFTGKGVKGALVRWFMKGVGTVPVNRSGGRAAEAALEAGLQVLEDGRIFGIYPEGTRSPDGRLYKGRTGVARLAIVSGAPLVPMAVIDTHLAQPKGKIIPKLGAHIGVKFGQPMDFSHLRDKVNDRDTLRAVTDQIVAAIQELSGQEYVDIYASVAKTKLAAGEPVVSVADVAAAGAPAPADAAEPAPSSAGEAAQADDARADEAEGAAAQGAAAQGEAAAGDEAKGEGAEA
ncbi:MAG: lysophospholipid acyltransferase family protein [Buchananella hordeovulneris]|nr:lysophospholipid acyltransferase family protein [Buchananella hordeovulneris]